MPLIVNLIDLYALVVLAAVVLSWVRPDPDNPFVRVIESLTEPVLAPIRQAIPPLGGLDLSPLVLLIALQLLKRLFIF
jgi:YggT family protein